MAKASEDTQNQKQQENSASDSAEQERKAVEADSEWTSDDDSDYDSDDYEEEIQEEDGDDLDVQKAKRDALRKRKEKKLREEEEEEEVLEEDELWDFPPDKYKWTEDDLGEEWADAWSGDDKPGFDPELVEDPEEVTKLWAEGKGPPRRSYYVPYRKHYPLIPDDHPDIQTPQDVVEELERYEEFLTWRSYIFEDGSSYEGTVWDDLAHGKGVYVTALELCRYEGEWFQNMMEGHGVMEAHVPVPQPAPGTELAKKWKAQGKVLESDFLGEEDKEWLKADAEDLLENDPDCIDPSPFEEDELWIKHFGVKPEKGYYRYAGQWKHSRMHGCGVYEVNNRQYGGKFYFGNLLPVPGECTLEQVAVHASLAEIAAAKAKMFVNKPDGMVREMKGPYYDPQHPYMYEEEEMWMAPGFINAFYEVPDEWKVYVKEVDEEQQMWLNSFIKSPLRIPMPPELEYLWSQDEEFLLLSNKPSNPYHYHPEMDPQEKEDEILLHVPTGNLINWTSDPQGRLRFFVQPFREDGVVKPEDAIPIPLGFREFMGEVDADGNEIDERMRGLTPEQRKKLEKEDKEKEEEQQFQKEMKEIERRGNEEIEALKLELYAMELEDRIEELIEEEKRLTELELLQEAESEAQTDAEAEAERRRKDEDQEKFEKSEIGRLPGAPVENDPAEGYGEDDDEGEDEKKPRSFGKVAMDLPEKQSNSPLEKLDEPNHPPSFPTTFASLSMVPKMALKQFIDSSLTLKKIARINILRHAQEKPLEPVNAEKHSLLTFNVSPLGWQKCRYSDGNYRMSSASRPYPKVRNKRVNPFLVAVPQISSFHQKNLKHKSWSNCQRNAKTRSSRHTCFPPKLEVLSLCIPMDIL